MKIQEICIARQVLQLILNSRVKTSSSETAGEQIQMHSMEYYKSVPSYNKTELLKTTFKWKTPRHTTVVMWEELQAFRCRGAKPRAKIKVKARVKAKLKVSKQIWPRKWKLWNEQTKSSNSIKMSTENTIERSWLTESFRKDVMMWS